VDNPSDRTSNGKIRLIDQRKYPTRTSKSNSSARPETNADPRLWGIDEAASSVDGKNDRPPRGNHLAPRSRTRTTRAVRGSETLTNSISNCPWNHRQHRRLRTGSLGRGRRRDHASGMELNRPASMTPATASDSATSPAGTGFVHLQQRERHRRESSASQSTTDTTSSKVPI